jgi:hypothetical protein
VSVTEEEKLADQRAFEVWSKSEDVAVHFNDLIMRWRLQAVGVELTRFGGHVLYAASRNDFKVNFNSNSIGLT